MPGTTGVCEGLGWPNAWPPVLASSWVAGDTPGVAVGVVPVVDVLVADVLVVDGLVVGTLAVTGAGGA